MKKLLSIILLSVFLVTNVYALDDLEHQKSSRRWGHTSSPSYSVGGAIKTAGLSIFQIFRCTYDGDGTAHHEVRLWLGSASGTFDMRLGLQTLSANGIPSGTWMGATNSGYEDIQPVLGWNAANLGETVDLVEGEYYAIVFDDFSDVLDATHWVQTAFYQTQGTPSGRPEYLRDRNTRYETGDSGGYTLGASTIFYGQCPWAIATDQWEGQPYTTVNPYLAGGPGTGFGGEAWMQQNFIAENNMLVRGIGVIANRFANTNFPDDDLYYSFMDADDNVLRSGTHCLAQESGSSTDPKWMEKEFDSPVYLQKDKTYRIRWTSPGSTVFTDAWGIIHNAVVDSHPYNIMTFQGKTGYMTFKSAFGGAAADLDYADIPFYLMLKDSDQDMNYSRRKR